MKRSYGRDGMGRVTSDSLVTGAGAVVTSMTYAYDTDGNLVNRVTAGVGSESFGYDWAGRLVSWTDPSGKVTGYGYDGAGNRVSAAGVVATFDERNRMLADGAGTVIGWSPAGTMSSRAVGGVSTLFAYDGLGRMMSAGSVVYTVDGFDRVVTRGGVSLSYSGVSLQPTSDGTGVMSVLPDSTPVGSRSGSTGSVVVGNNHGDVVALTNTAGVVSDRWNYDPWGSVLARTGTADVPVGFQSSFTDPVSGMVDMGARWYAPTQAGFTSEDSWAGKPLAPVTMDRFSYANDNPIGMWDADGHKAAKPLVIKELPGGLTKAQVIDPCRVMFSFPCLVYRFGGKKTQGVVTKLVTIIHFFVQYDIKLELPYFARLECKDLASSIDICLGEVDVARQDPSAYFQMAEVKLNSVNAIKAGRSYIRKQRSRFEALLPPGRDKERWKAQFWVPGSYQLVCQKCFNGRDTTWPASSRGWRNAGYGITYRWNIAGSAREGVDNRGIYVYDIGLPDRRNGKEVIKESDVDQLYHDLRAEAVLNSINAFKVPGLGLVGRPGPTGPLTDINWTQTQLDGFVEELSAWDWAGFPAAFDEWSSELALVAGAEDR